MAKEFTWELWIQNFSMTRPTLDILGDLIKDLSYTRAIVPLGASTNKGVAIPLPCGVNECL